MGIDSIFINLFIGIFLSKLFLHFFFSIFEKIEKDTICSICFDPLQSGVKLKCDCQYYYHKACIKKWLIRKSACPICKKDPNIDFSFTEFINRYKRIKKIIEILLDI